MADNSRHLIDAAAARRAATITRAVEAIQELDRAGQPVTFRTVAAVAGVSRSWLYREPGIRDTIQRLRPQATAVERRRRPAAERATADSLRQRAEALRAEIAELRAENRQLRDQLARRLGQQRHVGDMSTTQASS